MGHLFPARLISESLLYSPHPFSQRDVEVRLETTEIIRIEP